MTSPAFGSLHTTPDLQRGTFLKCEIPRADAIAVPAGVPGERNVDPSDSISRLPMAGVVLLFLLSLLPPTLSAQSPYRLSWKTDGVVGGTAGGLGIVALVTDKHFPGLTPTEISLLSPADVNSFDRPAVENYSARAGDASTVINYALIAAPLSLFFSERVRDDAATFGTMYLEAMAIAALIPHIVKGTVSRPRPFTYNPAVPLDEKTDPEARKSLFSGHTTSAFAAAVFLSTTYGDYFPESSLTPYLWGVSLSAAAAVAILRVTAGQHFATDVILGAVVGSAVGYIVPLVHRVTIGDVEPSLSFLPGGPAITCTYRF